MQSFSLPGVDTLATSPKTVVDVFSHFRVLLDFGMARDVYETDYYRKGGKGI